MENNDTMDKYRGLKVPKMSKEELAEFWCRVKDNRDCSCQEVSIFCGNLTCRSCIWSRFNSDKRYDYLKSVFEKEEGAKETMEENKTIEEFLRPGVLFKTESGEWYINIRGYYAYNVTLDERGDWCIKGMYTNIVRPKDVIEAYDVGETAAGASENMPLLVSDIGIIIKGLNLPCHIKTWKRPTPIKELTMSDLEKHFGCKVKVVKDN